MPGGAPNDTASREEILFLIRTPAPAGTGDILEVESKNSSLFTTQFMKPVVPLLGGPTKCTWGNSKSANILGISCNHSSVWAGSGVQESTCWTTYSRCYIGAGNCANLRTLPSTSVSKTATTPRDNVDY